MTTPTEIRAWLEAGKTARATHMIVVCDTFDHEDYPAYVKTGVDVRALVDQLNNPAKMSRVMEVYSYALDLESQLAEQRAWHIE